MGTAGTLDGLEASLARLAVPAGSKASLCAAVAEVQAVAPDVAPRLLNALTQLCNDVHVGAATNGSSAAPKALATSAAPSIPEEDVLTRVPGVSCLAPRGKFELLLCADRVALRNARTTLVLPLADLARVYILDGMGGDKAGKVVLLLQLQPGRHVVHGKQQLANFAMEVKADAQLDVPALRGVGDNVKGAAPIVLCNLLGCVGVKEFVAPDGVAFKSAGGACAVEALYKLNQGWLVPMKGAIVYVGSKCWDVQLADILGVDLPGAHTGRRTFDVVLHAHDGSIIAELQQIDAKHLSAFEEYMATTGLRIVAGVASDDAEPGSAGRSGKEGAARQRRSAAATTSADPTAAGADDDSDDDEDADFDPEGSSDGEGGSRGDGASRKRKRAASGDEVAGTSAAAQQATSSDDGSESSGDEHDYVSDDITDDDGGPGS